MKRKNIIITVVVIVAVLLVIYLVSANKGSKYQFVAVTQGSITEVVSVTGNTTPVQSLDLAFPAGGTVAAVYKQAGDNVSAGDAIAKLNTNSLQAQLAQAQASVDSA